MTDQLAYPIDDINLVLRACNPAEPLPPGDTRWCDFMALRERNVVQEMLRILLASPAEGEFHHRILCGHRGSGKSTELLRLMDEARKIGFFPVRTEADVTLGLIPVDPYDLFLLTAVAVEKAMQEAGRPLPRKHVERIVKWFAEVIREEKKTVKSELSVGAGAKLEAGVPLLGKLFGKLFAAAKTGSEQAQTVRQQLRNFPDTLIDLTNELLRAANAGLKKKKGYSRGLLLVLDNLDRYEPQSIDRVLMRGASLVRRLASHAIFTIPVELEYAPLSGPIQDEYGPAFVLPMLALRGRDQTWKGTVAESDHKESAVQAVRKALEQRIDVNALFEDPQDADLLVKMSGGCMRDLLHLVTLAFQLSEDKFPHSAVLGAIHLYRAQFVRRLTHEDYERLARIAHRESVPRDELTRRLLYHRSALEYVEKGRIWMDVHPIIVEIDGFQRAYGSRSSPAQG